ncbi:uncharacterized protein LOC119075665 isoform X2 [Bradysia coprophila]|uniref:uncharacterized protein LOC119075665 isoform X2 n=1 Tax=Bradysia coprophila TaxID=38358 RepID=UPI00187D6E8F|nr:uncharacterized protein LOC119075665 isoform X2 [Bradysia coprophila]
MARTKKASNGQRNRKTTQQPQSSAIAKLENNETLPSTNDVDNKSDNKNRGHVSTIMPTARDKLSGSKSFSLRSKDENVTLAGSVSSNIVDGECNENDKSAISDDLDISGISALMTDDSEASVIDLTDSIHKTEEIANDGSGDDQQGSMTTRRKSIRKPLKRLACTTTPRYNVPKQSKGTPYIRKVSSTNHRNNLANEIKLSTGKKDRIADEIKTNGNVKRVTFNNSPSMKPSSSAAKSNQLNHQRTSTNRKQATSKMPNFSAIHEKMFEKMESIDVTVRKREERMKAASSKKEGKGYSQGKVANTESTKSKKVVRKLDNTQAGPSNITHVAEAVNELPKSSRSKSLRAAPKVEVLQERSNRDAVFKFTGISDPKIVAPLPDKKTVENRSSRRQQAYKARPVPKTHPQSSNRLNGVRLNRRFELQMKYRETQNEL